MKNIKILLVLVLLGLTLVSCGKNTEIDETNNITSSVGETENNLSAEIETISVGEIESTTSDVGETENNLNSNSGTTMSNKTEVNKGDNISVHYTGTLEDGTKFDSSLDRGTPLEFTAGAGQMIPGFDAGVIGMKKGEKKIIEIEAKDAYGEYDETKVQVIPRKDLESFVTAGKKLEAGEKIPTQMGELTIIKSDEENVTLDVNHSLAGKKLIFDVEIIEIK